MAQATRKGAAAKKAPKAPTTKELAASLKDAEERLQGAEARIQHLERQQLDYRLGKAESKIGHLAESTKRSLGEFKKSVKKHAIGGVAAFAALTIYVVILN